MNHIIHELKKKVENGTTISEAITEMGNAEFTILEAIKTTRELFQMRLGEAKEVVSEHPSYREIASGSNELHQEILNNLENKK